MVDLTERLRLRINEERDKIKARLENVSELSPMIYYWGKNAKPHECGVATSPSPTCLVLPQLLLRPRLIVDILPKGEPEFKRIYGVTIAQMENLCREGYVIPNIYEFGAGAWIKYVEIPDLGDLLAKYGVPNNEWINSYLHAKFDFLKVRHTHIEFFDAENYSEADKDKLWITAHGGLRSWKKFAELYGQRLAYIETLGNKEHKNLVQWVTNNFHNQTNLRPDILKVLNATKHLVATRVTAAFGGTITLDPFNLKEIRDAEDTVATWTRTEVSTIRHDLKGLPHPLLEYVAEIARRSELYSATPGERGDLAQELITGVLDSDQFQRFKRVLKKVRELGGLGKFCDGVTQAISDPMRNPHVIMQEFRAIEDELNRNLKPLAPIAEWLSVMAPYWENVFETSPQQTIKLTAFAISMALRSAAAFCEEQERIPFFKVSSSKYPTQIYGEWRKIRDALGLLNDG